MMKEDHRGWFALKRSCVLFITASQKSTDLSNLLSFSFNKEILDLTLMSNSFKKAAVLIMFNWMIYNNKYTLIGFGIQRIYFTSINSRSFQSCWITSPEALGCWDCWGFALLIDDRVLFPLAPNIFVLLSHTVLIFDRFSSKIVEFSEIRLFVRILSR